MRPSLGSELFIYYAGVVGHNYTCVCGYEFYTPILSPEGAVWSKQTKDQRFNILGRGKINSHTA